MVPAIGRRRLGLIAMAGVWVILSLRYSAVPAFKTPAEDRAVVAAARAARRLSRSFSSQSRRASLNDIPMRA